jgi:alanyl-tRNA synthetase
MTTRLYYTAPYERSFEAAVVSCEAHSARVEVLLDRTAFYPTSGGQPFDIGSLGEAVVLDVLDRDDGEIVHVVDRPLAVGATVTGAIDWKRRFDHMQQHTGQHVLSAAYDHLFNARTESFHLGSTASTIDLGRPVSAEEIQAAEDEANRIVWDDRPVSIRFVTAEEAARLPLRKEPARTGSLRLIEVEDFDLSACGGTHVSRTGAVGVIATSGWEKFRGGTRVEFLCGGRTLGRFREWRAALAATARHLSVSASDLAATVERMGSEAKSLQRTIRALQEQLAIHEAKVLLGRGAADNGRLVVVEALEGWDAPGLKALATAITAGAAHSVVALFSRSVPALVVVARGASVLLDASAVLKALVGQFGGKGGGKPDLAQGGGLNADADDLVAAASALLRR